MSIGITWRRYRTDTLKHLESKALKGLHVCTDDVDVCVTPPWGTKPPPPSQAMPLKVSFLYSKATYNV